MIRMTAIAVMGTFALMRYLDPASLSVVSYTEKFVVYLTLFLIGSGGLLVWIQKTIFGYIRKIETNVYDALAQGMKNPCEVSLRQTRGVMIVISVILSWASILAVWFFHANIFTALLCAYSELKCFLTILLYLHSVTPLPPGSIKQKKPRESRGFHWCGSIKADYSPRLMSEGCFYVFD